MEAIIEPVALDLLLAELTPERKLMNTNKGGNELYVFTAAEAPNLMREVGRLREEAFRAEGGCSGKSIDVDDFDYMDKPYRQLIVWDPEYKAILGGYRYILGSDVTYDADGIPNLATAELFNYSERFLKEYLPHTIELGRSFVSAGFQSSKSVTKAIYALDNLWDGIAAVVLQNKPQIKYLFGKATIHPDYNKDAFALLDTFIGKYYSNGDSLVTPKTPVENNYDKEELGQILCFETFEEDYRRLKSCVQAVESYIPPLVNSYMTLSPTMMFFGFAPCHDLVGATEGGLLITFDEIFPAKLQRHLDAYHNWFGNK